MAIEVGLSEGRQHTLPGSVGETTGSYEAVGRVAVLWEIQPNVLKPGEGRNATIAKEFRKHRNWHVATLIAAIEWLSQRDAEIFILRGAALPATHQVNPNAVLSSTIQDLHERTVSRVDPQLSAASSSTLPRPRGRALRIRNCSMWVPETSSACTAPPRRSGSWCRGQGSRVQGFKGSRIQGFKGSGGGPLSSSNAV